MKAPIGSMPPALSAMSAHSRYRLGFPAEQVAVRQRPLRRHELSLVRAFMRRMHRDDLYRRFGHPFDFEDEMTLRRFIDAKPGIGEMAWVLDESAAIAGISHRIMVSGSEAEVALMVRSDLKRRGVGEFLLGDMLARSAREGLETLSGLVLRDNRAALRLAAKFGFVPRQVCAFAVELAREVGPTAPLQPKQPTKPARMVSKNTAAL